MSQQTDSESQTDVASSDVLVESKAASSVSDTQLSAGGLLSSQDTVANESFDEFGTSLLSQTIGDTSFVTGLERPLVTDGFSQTDPVTIIIGDASFLVKKVGFLVS